VIFDRVNVARRSSKQGNDAPEKQINHLQISTAGIKVEVYRLASNIHRAQVERVVCITGHSRRTAVGSEGSHSLIIGTKICCLLDVVGDLLAEFAERLCHGERSILEKGLAFDLLDAEFTLPEVDRRGDGGASEGKRCREGSERRHG
jgi:hypothetical protein